MNRIVTFFAFAAIFCLGYARNEHTVIVNPAEKASSGVRINWHTDYQDGSNVVEYTKRTDKRWKHSKRAMAESEVVTAYDSLSSKRANGENFIEHPRILRHTVELADLKPATEYMYRFGQSDNDSIRHFKTAPKKGAWTAAVISDFHSYPPLPKRAMAAMAMLDTLERVNGGDFDFVLHVGDVCAWGGSYSFWEQLYSKPQFAKYMWAGVNGNHDNMDRQSSRLSNQYFRYANNNPLNGYQGEEGVCYYFKYGQVLFIMLNNENMRTEQGLQAAQQWVRKTIDENPAKYIVVMEHYQWFFGTDGRTSQYSRWHTLFDECGVDLAIAGNNHIYARTNAIYRDAETDGSQGTVYVQTPSSDNERGQETKDWTENKDKIKYIWSEGGRTVGALLMKVDDKHITLTLYDRVGNNIDTVDIACKR